MMIRLGLVFWVIMCIAFQSAQSQFLIVRPSSLPSATRQVATHTFIPHDLSSSATATQAMSRTRHTAINAISSLKVVTVAVYGIVETLMPGTTTQTESIEYPVGVCTAAKYSGVSSISYSGGNSLITTDNIAVSIPAGATFYRRTYQTNASGIIFANTGDNANGEAMHWGTSGITDQTVSCDAVTNSVASQTSYPAAIIGSTSSKAICIEGDSRSFGAGDTYDSSGDIGNVARTVGLLYPYLNLSSGSKTAGDVVGNHTTQVLLSQYCSSLIVELGINDVISGTTAAVVLSRLQSIYTAFNLPTWQTTLEPNTSSTDSWTTTANQTAAASTIKRIGVNNGIRAGTAQVKGFFDVANAVEFGSGSVLTQDGQLWCVSGNPGTVVKYCTGDGLHENQTGYLTVRNSAVINNSLLQ